jgi:hypothetical protein
MHALRFDLFGRGTQSPAAVPTIAVAALFGPLGVLAVGRRAGALQRVRRSTARLEL